METAAVHDALLKVPEKLRVCMVLHYVDGFKHREIAAMLGISEDAVRMRVARGSGQFRKLYGPSRGEDL
jgi:RNA polymerase sigma-70 factor (ECF subfamily)